jgi:hypothetical protein
MFFYQLFVEKLTDGIRVILLNLVPTVQNRNEQEQLADKIRKIRILRKWKIDE